jgi:hypothetical protein
MRRWTCHAVVGAWGLVLLAQPASPLSIVSLPLPEPEEEVVASVRPVEIEDPEPPVEAPPPEPPPQPVAKQEPPKPEPPAEPEPEPEPEVEEEVAAEDAEARPVDAADLAAGGALLDGAGGFPVLSFGYEDFPSFRSYARAMTRLGARFVVVQRREIVGTVDLDTASTGRFAGGAFSPRARDYTGEPGLTPLARAARERYGDRAVVMMLVPRQLDAGLFGGLARALDERGEPHAGLSEIRGRYERGPAGGIRLRLEGAVRRDGTVVPMDALFDLAQIAGGSPA